MDKPPRAVERLRIAWSALFSEVALSLMGYGPLRALPTPRIATPSGIARLEDLWLHIERIPREDRHESAFASTIRVAKGDLRRKLSDQLAGMAGVGPTPWDFQAIHEAMPSPRAPLHALFRTPVATRPIVIVVHGLYDSKLSRYVVLLADALVRQGFGILLPDMRWHGRLLSRDWLPTLGIEEALDLLEWGQWLQRSLPGCPVGLLGFSLGALDVIHAISREASAEVLQAGGIAVSPPASLRRTLQTLDQRARLSDLGLDAFLRMFFQEALGTRMKALGVNGKGEGLFVRLLNWLVGRLALEPDLTTARFLDLADPHSLLPACRRPLLVLASRNDPIYREQTGGTLVEKAKGNPFVRVIETPGGGHTGQPGCYPQWMADVLNQFYSLTPGVSAAPADL